jgi:uncharacterized protein YecE (DUF72 family)
VGRIDPKRPLVEHCLVLGYPSTTLSAWRKSIILWRRKNCDVYVYFDNDQKSAAPMDALALRGLLVD